MNDVTLFGNDNCSMAGIETTIYGKQPQMIVGIAKNRHEKWEDNTNRSSQGDEKIDQRKQSPNPAHLPQTYYCFCMHQSQCRIQEFDNGGPGSATERASY